MFGSTTKSILGRSPGRIFPPAAAAAGVDPFTIPALGNVVVAGSGVVAKKSGLEAITSHADFPKQTNIT